MKNRVKTIKKKQIKLRRTRKNTNLYVDSSQWWSAFERFCFRYRRHRWYFGFFWELLARLYIDRLAPSQGLRDIKQISFVQTSSRLTNVICTRAEIASCMEMPIHSSMYWQTSPAVFAPTFLACWIRPDQLPWRILPNHPRTFHICRIFGGMSYSCAIFSALFAIAVAQPIHLRWTNSSTVPCRHRAHENRCLNWNIRLSIHCMNRSVLS